jgi:hypothetical protein
MKSMLGRNSSHKTLAGVILLFLALAMSSFSFAQASGQISGKYSNIEAGVEIMFPTGWAGSEVSTANSITTTLYPQSVPSGQDRHAVAMYLTMSDKSAFQEPITNAAPPGYDLDCDIISTANINVAGVIGLLTGSSCTDTNGAEYELESVLVNTNTRWIVLSLFAEEELYEEYVDARFAALDSLKVNGAMDVKGYTTSSPPAPLEMRTSTEHVIVNGEAISVFVNSSSSIVSFELDEDDRELQVTTESTSQADESAKELTKISIGRILTSPYVITIDGDVIDEWFVDTDTGEPILWISHQNGTRDIVVKGTTVVPEFSFLGPSIMLSLIVSFIVLVRLRSTLRISRI